MRDPQTAEPIEEEPEVPGSIDNPKGLYPPDVNDEPDLEDDEADSDPEKAPRRLTSNNGPIANTPETRGPVHPLDMPKDTFDEPDDIGVDII